LCDWSSDVCSSDLFEVGAWSEGQTAGVTPGMLVPIDTKFTFDLDLTDPLVLGYLQRGINEGRLRFMISSLHPTEQSGAGGTGAYPQWYSKENLLGDPPQ